MINENFKMFNESSLKKVADVIAKFAFDNNNFEQEENEFGSGLQKLLNLPADTAKSQHVGNVLSPPQTAKNKSFGKLK